VITRVQFFNKRAEELFNRELFSIQRHTDRMFGWLLLFQYVGAIVWTFLRSPATWEGNRNAVHPHVITAIVLGGLATLPTIFLITQHEGKPITRHVVAIAQMVMAGLLIHVSGGRIETHFQVFVSLAFLASYRDWRILIPATLVVLADHIVRGIYFPASIYGVDGNAQWRFLEHAGWVVFENVILVMALVRTLAEMRTSANRRAQLEETQAKVEGLVVDRTEALRKSELRKSSIISNALDGIISMDSAGVVVEFNPAAEAMFGFRKVDIVGKDLADHLIPPEFRAQHREGYRRFVDTGVNRVMNSRIEIFGLRSSGEQFPMELTIIPVSMSDAVLFTAFVRDITERKHLETELAHAQKMESIGRLASGVAHEISTPNQYIGDNIRFIGDSFVALTSAVDQLRDIQRAAVEGPVDPELLVRIEREITELDLEYLLEEVPRAAAHALEGVERVASIVSAMKEFSHPGLHTWTTANINRVLESTVTVARNQWKAVANVEYDLDEDLPLIYCHPGELGQVFLNLVVNASHAIGATTDGRDGRIRISTKLVDGVLEIVIEDNGCGIPAQAQTKIFDPFFTTKDVGVGTGQGLTISRTVVVEHHKGEIKFDTEEGRGTKFTVLLPLLEQETLEEAA